MVFAAGGKNNFSFPAGNESCGIAVGMQMLVLG
jgi:hypothetical protein